MVDRRFLIRGLFVALVALGLSSCAAPTLPLPPPEAPEMRFEDADHVTLSSDRGAEPNAVIVLLNRNPEVDRQARLEATQADEAGSWRETIVAHPGDLIDITQQFGKVRSAPITVRIPTRPSN